MSLKRVVQPTVMVDPLIGPWQLNKSLALPIPKCCYFSLWVCCVCFKRFKSYSPLLMFPVERHASSSQCQDVLCVWQRLCTAVGLPWLSVFPSPQCCLSLALFLSSTLTSLLSLSRAHTLFLFLWTLLFPSHAWYTQKHAQLIAVHN